MNSSQYPWIIAVAAVLIAASAGFMLLSQPAPPPAGDDAAAILIGLQSDITVALETLDGRLGHATSAIGRTDLTDDAARAILADLSATDPAIVDCTVSNTEAILMAAEPAEYHGTEGADLRDQPNVQHILASKRPIMSDLITVAEGFPAVVISTPIFTDESRFVGFSSIVIQPDILIAGLVAEGTPFQVMVVQKDGRILYETDPTQIGRMTFEDPLYADHPDLLNVARRVSAERYGTASYAFAAGGQAVQKEITWTTVGLHGTEWRVAVIRETG